MTLPLDISLLLSNIWKHCKTKCKCYLICSIIAEHIHFQCYGLKLFNVRLIHWKFPRRCSSTSMESN